MPWLGGGARRRRRKEGGLTPTFIIALRAKGNEQGHNRAQDTQRKKEGSPTDKVSFKQRMEIKSLFPHLHLSPSPHQGVKR